MPPKKSARDLLASDALGNLQNYDHDELAALREKLIEDLSRIDQEQRHHDEAIKFHNVAKQGLTQQRADRGRALRAIRHELSLRGRPERDSVPTTLVAQRGSRRRMLRP